MKVDFKYEIDQVVSVNLCGEGRVNMAALDDHGNKTYYIVFPNGRGGWHKESLISLNGENTEVAG